MPDASTLDTGAAHFATRASTKQARILAIANQKGGVGKTTTAINLGTAIASVGRRVLVIDLDPQGNASTGLNIDRQSRSNSIYELLLGEITAEEAILRTSVENLSVMPSTQDLSGVDIQLMEAERGRFRLRDSLRDTQANLPFDYILIDCPPSLNLLTLNALTAADSVLVPLQCEFFALEGLTLLLNTVQRVKKSLNPALVIQGVILTMFDRRAKLSGEVADEARQYLGDLVYETIIPRNTKLSEAQSHGMPALYHDEKGAGSQAYIKLANEMLERELDPVQ